MLRPIALAALLSTTVACGAKPGASGDDDITDTTPDAGVRERPDALDTTTTTTTTGTDGDPAACGVLHATLRDFKADHDDFENPGERMGGETGIVATDLGVDHKPVYAHDGPTKTVLSRATYDQWYRDVDGVNLKFETDLPLTETATGSGVFVFEDSDFFPLDGKGFPNEERLGHNFHFTTEAHATVFYRGGESFTFKGDDDVWVFVNGKLAIDLGGVHGVASATIDFDARAKDLGIEKGHSYAFDVFHAERHTSRSNFRIETSIECFTPVD